VLVNEMNREPITEVAAGGVVFRRAGDGSLSVLVIRDGHGNWGLPKGHLEAGETAEVAAIREVEEETALRDLRLGALIRTSEWSFRSERGLIRKICHFFLIEAPMGDAAPLLTEGITVCEWLSPEVARGRVTFDTTRVVLDEAMAMLAGGSVS
jgi:ADP-ribose pyrophosphatase YjhB (NUDIX family)